MGMVDAVRGGTDDGRINTGRHDRDTGNAATDLSRYRAAEMPHFDLTGDELRAYRPDLCVPPDLNDFWNRSIAEAPTAAPDFSAVDNRLVLVTSFDVTF